MPILRQTPLEGVKARSPDTFPMPGQMIQIFDPRSGQWQDGKALADGQRMIVFSTSDEMPLAGRRWRSMSAGVSGSAVPVSPSGRLEISPRMGGDKDLDPRDKRHLGGYAGK
jgi:hypothetical protein